MHISGAEGLYAREEIAEIVSEYALRALYHPRGEPDTIIVTVERISQEPAEAPLLPLETLPCASPGEARETLLRELAPLGVSARAFACAWRILHAGKTMRGAALVGAETGRRREPDRARGVRVSRLGIERTAERRLRRRLARLGINTPTVREALVLASKVASHPDVLAELCISDDPGYTTGYVASRATGYRRVPQCKLPGELHGGRVFFIREGASVGGLIAYLEKKPVIIGSAESAPSSGSGPLNIRIPASCKGPLHTTSRKKGNSEGRSR